LRRSASAAGEIAVKPGLEILVASLDRTLHDEIAGYLGNRRDRVRHAWTTDAMFGAAMTQPPDLVLIDAALRPGALPSLVRELADHAAALARARLDAATRGLAFASRAIPWAELSDAELSGALWLVYRQDDDIAAVALADARGASVAPSAYLDTPGREPELAA